MCVFCVVQITPIAIDNIGWRTFVIFAVLCFTWIPLVYAFFPETSGLQLEDIDHLFEKGGITGGVWGAKGGRTVMPGEHARQNDGKELEKVDFEGLGIERVGKEAI